MNGWTLLVLLILVLLLLVAATFAVFFLSAWRVARRMGHPAHLWLLMGVVGANLAGLAQGRAFLNGDHRVYIIWAKL